MATATKKTAAKPAAKAAAKPAPAAAAAETAFGVGDVAELIQVKTGKVVKNRDLRTLLRKMARDGRLDREIVAGNRARWEFDGPDDERVEKIIEAYEAGELDADKAEKLAALKERKAAQRAAAKAAEAEESDEDEELEDDEA
jgi:hypothetical protein